jgi:rhodanese-related sulfurtransferase
MQSCKSYSGLNILGAIMKQFLYSLFFVFAAFTGYATAQEQVQEVSVEDVQKFVQDKPANVAILDVNNDDARKDAGVVPSAILLTSYNQYAISELPKDKNTTLVFYCYNSYCQASHTAALRAIGAGYKDARVMKAGIAGWNKVNKT